MKLCLVPCFGKDGVATLYNRARGKEACEKGKTKEFRSTPTSAFHVISRQKSEQALAESHPRTQ